MEIDFEDNNGFGNMRSDAQSGWVYQPNQLIRACERNIRQDCVSARVNGQSLREDYETDFEKPSGVQRILVLGDSQTAGEYLANSETYPNILEVLLNADGSPIEVINAGVPAYSPAQEWIWFRDQGIRYQADIILIGVYVGNDLVEMLPDDFLPRPGFQVTPDGKVVLKEYPISIPDSSTNKREKSSKEFLPRLKEALQPFYIYRLVRYVMRIIPQAAWLRKIGVLTSDPLWSDSSKPDDPRSRAAFLCHGCLTQSLSQAYYFISFPEKERVALLLVKETLKRLQVDSSASNSKLVLLLIPSKSQIEPETQENLSQVTQLLGLDPRKAAAYDNEIYRRILKLGQELNIDVIDTLPTFLDYHQHNDELLYFNNDWHLSPIGHRVLAMQVYTFFENEFPSKAK
jgi:lysophospholipase L1-like esterase